jgi:hypothetical protein
MIPELIFLAVAIVAIIAVAVHKQKRKMEPEASAHEPVNNVDEATTFPGYVIVDGKKYEGTVKIMAVGLQVYNASGKLVLDYTEPTYQMYGTGHAVGGKSGSISNSKITANTVIIPYKISITGYSGAGDFNYDWIAAQEAIMPNFSITAGKISWSYASKYSSYDGYVDMYFWYGGVPK